MSDWYGPDDEDQDDEYDPEDFGADGITHHKDWRGSGYDHYTAWSDGGGQISWDVDPDGDYLDDSIHISGRNIPDNNDWG